MMKILFIHGLNGGQNGGTATELRSQLGAQTQLYAPAFSNDLTTFDNALANIELAKHIISQEKIDLVVGSSMGGFTALHLSGIPTIVINPCMKPSEQFGTLLPEISEMELERYRELEACLAPSDYEKKNTYGLFALEDELFSFRDQFSTLFGRQNIMSMPGTHRNTADRVRDYIMPLIIRVSDTEDK